MKLDLSAFRAAIFDLDGTLVVTEHVWQAAKRSAALNYRVNVSDALLDAHVGRRLSDFTNEVLGSREADGFVHEQVEAQIMKTARVSMADEIIPIEGAADFVRHIHAMGLDLAICSSSTPDMITLALERLQVAPLFAAIVSAAELAEGKPHPEPYLKTIRALGRTAGECIAFEDSLPGATSAKAAGLFTVGVGSDVRSPNFDFCDLRFPTLLGILDG